MRVSAVALFAPTCGPADVILGNGTHYGDNLTVAVPLPNPPPTVLPTSVTLTLPVWLMRNATVTVTVLGANGGSLPPANMTLTDPPAPTALTASPVVTGTTPALNQLRPSGATSITLTGTALDSLPNHLLVGPYLLSVSGRSPTSATLSGLPVQGSTVGDLMSTLPRAVGGTNVNERMHTLRSLLVSPSGTGCPVAELEAQLTGLPPATPVDITDFLIRPNGSVALLGVTQ